jgi:hypothetical protein
MDQKQYNNYSHLDDLRPLWDRFRKRTNTLLLQAAILLLLFILSFFL